MRVGDCWKSLTRRLGIEQAPKPQEYEVFNGTVVFWFGNASEVKTILVKLKEAGIPYQIEWDREEGLMGISLKRSQLG